MGKSLIMQPTTTSNSEKCRSKKQFDKRMRTLEKAAKDLSTLCGVDAAMIVHAPPYQPLISTSIWPPADNQQQVLAGLIDSYRDTSRIKKTTNLSDFFNDKAGKIEDEIKKLLMAKIDNVRRRINDLMKESNSNRLLTESSSADHHIALKDFYSNYPVEPETGVFGPPTMCNHEEPVGQECGVFGPIGHESGAFGPTMLDYEEPGVFGPSMLNFEEPVGQESVVFGPIMWNHEEPIDQECGVFGPSMLNSEELSAQDLVYYSCDSDQANENSDHIGNDQLMMMMMGYGVSNGMYEFEENNILPGDIETWPPGSFDIVVPIDEQVPLDMESCFSSSINNAAGGSGSEDHDQMLSAMEWFLNEES